MQILHFNINALKIGKPFALLLDIYVARMSRQIKDSNNVEVLSCTVVMFLLFLEVTCILCLK